jgi:hypothetical protein
LEKIENVGYKQQIQRIVIIDNNIGIHQNVSHLTIVRQHTLPIDGSDFKIALYYFAEVKKGLMIKNIKHITFLEKWQFSGVNPNPKIFSIKMSLQDDFIKYCKKYSVLVNFEFVCVNNIESCGIITLSWGLDYKNNTIGKDISFANSEFKSIVNKPQLYPVNLNLFV